MLDMMWKHTTAKDVHVSLKHDKLISEKWINQDWKVQRIVQRVMNDGPGFKVYDDHFDKN